MSKTSSPYKKKCYKRASSYQDKNKRTMWFFESKQFFINTGEINQQNIKPKENKQKVKKEKKSQIKCESPKIDEFDISESEDISENYKSTPRRSPRKRKLTKRYAEENSPPAKRAKTSDNGE